MSFAEQLDLACDVLTCGDGDKYVGSRDMIVLTPAEDGVVKKCHLSHYQWKETDSEPKVFESAKNKAVIDKCKPLFFLQS